MSQRCHTIAFLSPLTPHLLLPCVLVYNNHLAWAAAKGSRNPCNHKSHFAPILSARVPPPQVVLYARYESSAVSLGPASVSIKRLARSPSPRRRRRTHTLPLLPSRILGLSGAWSLPNLTISRVLGSNVALVYPSILILELIRRSSVFVSPHLHVDGC